MYTQIDSYRLCSGADLVDLVDLGTLALTGVFPRSLNEEVPCGPLALVRCIKCGLVQLKHNFELTSLYGETYGYRSGLNQSMVEHLQSKVRQIEQMVNLAPGDCVVDIGSNDGTLLNSYRIPGLKRIGIDPTGAKFHEFYDPDVELIPEFFSARAIKSRTTKKARAVTSIAMFYDLEDPLNFVEQILEILADDGLWVLEQSYLPLMVEANAYDTICHEHLEYYTLEQILYITDKLDLKVVALETNDTNGGSFSLAIARRKSPYREAREEVRCLLEKEAKEGYRGLEPFERLRNSMESHRDALGQFLHECKRNGDLVLGYGASTKGNVLLQYCGVSRDLLPCIGEVNPDKYGAFTPGTKIPIVPEADVRAKRPSYLLVLPWHFRRGIVQKEARYLEGGGGLVFPLPKLEVVTSAGALSGVEQLGQTAQAGTDAGVLPQG